MQPPE